MKIRIEVDVKPEELRRFLGLPDVAGLQDEFVQFLREKIAADPKAFLKDNLDQLLRSRAVQRVLYGTGGRSADPDDPDADVADEGPDEFRDDRPGDEPGDGTGGDRG